jgi:hypothetical protein
MAEYTITRALVELKKIARELDTKVPQITMFLAKGENQKVANTTHQEAVKATQAQQDEVSSRIARYGRIQNAIHSSNATTYITLGDKTMTVLEAINLKKTVQFKKNFLNRLVAVRNQALKSKATADQALEDEITSTAQVLAGAGKAPTAEQLQTVRDSLEANKKTEIVSLEAVNKTIATLEAEISMVESELDFTLSESNALTKVVIQD